MSVNEVLSRFKTLKNKNIFVFLEDGEILMQKSVKSQSPAGWAVVDIFLAAAAGLP